MTSVSPTVCPDYSRAVIHSYRLPHCRAPATRREGTELVLSDLLPPADGGAESCDSTQEDESLPATFRLSDSEVSLAACAACLLL